jgi:hypothetical protein
MLSVSYYLFMWQNWTFSTPAGFWNLSGNLSLLVGAVIVATSMAAVRHRAYEAFRAVHYTLWLVRVGVRRLGCGAPGAALQLCGLSLRLR